MEGNNLMGEHVHREQKERTGAKTGVKTVNKQYQDQGDDMNEMGK